MMIHEGLAAFVTILTFQPSILPFFTMVIAIGRNTFNWRKETVIQTYAHQKELHESRLSIKTLECMFANLITDGTNCSPFESEIIVEKAKGRHQKGQMYPAHELF